MNNSDKVKLNPRKTFWKCGACSHAMFHLLNHEFDNIKPEEEKASDLLAGGIAMKGHQCGMLWGASLAAGIESFHRFNDKNEATTAAINASKHLVKSFHHRAGTVNCRDITKVDWEKKSHFVIFMLKTIAQGFVFSPCFKFIEKWTPEAIQAAENGLSEITNKNQPIHSCEKLESQNKNSFYETKQNQLHLSCATEVLRKMGASDEACITVAGLAGGIGLSGNGCGALSAVIWHKMLVWGKNNPGKTPEMFNDPITKKILKAFYNQTGSEMLCHKICGTTFTTINEHTEYLKSGGCRNLIEALANT